MEVLTNYLAGDYTQKSRATEAADWILTPYRNLFNGKDVELIINYDEAQKKWNFGIETTPYRPSPLKKILFAIAAILISPLALIAAIFKHWNLLSPPNISGEIGSDQAPLTVEEPSKLSDILIAFIPGKVTYFYTDPHGQTHKCSILVKKSCPSDHKSLTASVIFDSISGSDKVCSRNS